MRRLILLAFIGIFLTSNTALSKARRYPSNLAWLFSAHERSNETKGETRTVCQTEECQKIAKVITESMDKSVEPCDDFYEYACGKWPEHNPVPKGMIAWNLWHMVNKDIEKKIEGIMQRKVRSDDLLAVKLAKNWYTACMDTDALEKLGLEPLISTVSRIGGWPITMEPDEWDEEEYRWQKVDDQYARLYGRNAFHDVLVSKSDGENETTMIIQIDIPDLPPQTYKLWAMQDGSSEEEDGDEEDSSEQQEESQEPGSEGESEMDEKSDDDDNDDDKSGDDDDDDNNDDDSYDDDNDDEAVKKKKKSTSKLGHKKRKKLSHNGKAKNDKHVAKRKHSSHKVRKQKREVATRIGAYSRRSAHRNKFNTRRNKRTRKNLEHSNAKITTSTTPSPTTESASEEIDSAAIRQQYYDYISKVARAIAKERGMEVSEEQIGKDVQDIIDFQLKLADITLKLGEEEMNSTLADFQEWYDEKKPKTPNSEIDWMYKIPELFDEAGVAVDGDFEIELDSPDYFEALVSLLDETPSRTIVNYIHWSFISEMLKTTTSEMRDLYDSWAEIEEKEKEDRSSHCAKVVYLSDVISYEYVRNYCSEDVIKTATDMIDDIQKEVEYEIKESNWMDDDLKDSILAKLVKMKKLVGYPNWYRNSTVVKKVFQGLIVGKSYYENSLSYSRYMKWSELRRLLEEEDDTEEDEQWWMRPTTLNAMYMPLKNSITITAADFQSPFFAYGRPQTINFGIIGFIMAHEVNHGFDNDGFKYDKDGDPMEWLEEMAEAFGERAGCFVDQFNNYTVNKIGEKVKNYGNQTAGENIADTLGLQAVFNAYHRRERECGKPDSVLPGLEDLTNDQLFFLSFANLWCEAVKPEEVVKRAKRDVHSTGRLRVIGSVSNTEDFAKAYNCPTGSAMNPEKKCNIWK